MATDATRVENVLVVGGGDSGLLTALCLRKLHPDLELTVVDDFEAALPTVGKSTYADIKYVLHGFLEIPEDRFLADVQPIWKGSVYFRDWCGTGPFHYPFDDLQKYPADATPDCAERYYYLYDELFDDPERRTVCEAMVEEGKSPIYFQPRTGGYGKYRAVAYHFDTTRLNAFLRTLCDERGIDLLNDEITSVASRDGRIESVRSADRSYEGDLYVDASGFTRVLKSELDDTFNAFDLPLDTAVTADVDRPLADVVPATVIETGEYGWFWSIDTYDRRDLGYVFASAFVSEADATAEFVEHCDGRITTEEVRTYEFSSGYYETPWQGNCVTIGNAVGFVEPLQSTGLTANAMAATKLATVLAAHGAIQHDGARALYNNWVRQSWESIYDFVCVHYLHAAGTSDFWETMQSIRPSPRLAKIREYFDENGFDTQLDPIAHDDEIAELSVFPLSSFYSIMRSMGAQSSFYEEHSFEVSDAVKAAVDEYYEEADARVADFLTTEEVYRGMLALGEKV